MGTRAVPQRRQSSCTIYCAPIERHCCHNTASMRCPTQRRAGLICTCKVIGTRTVGPAMMHAITIWVVLSLFIVHEGKNATGVCEHTVQSCIVSVNPPQCCMSRIMYLFLL